MPLVSPAPAIVFERVSVRFRVPHGSTRSLKEHAIRFFQRRVTYETFWALRDVTLSVQAGEMFAVVGRNGAGKSTLLKLVARVLRPTEGRVRVHGLVAPLLNLGAGFHPDLTGRENVFLNGTLLGMTRGELVAAYDDILAFSELAPMIDAPLGTYSSGMVARLGFAIATQRRPDILLVDETLAVGDTEFRRKCTDRIEQFRTAGTTILLVSHDLGFVAGTCQRAAWLADGRLQMTGLAAEVAAAYQKRAQNVASAARRPMR